MSDIEQTNSAIEETDSGKTWTTSLSVIGAILASSCCILPFVFLMLGVSGAWIGTLTALEPYKNYFSAITLVFIGLGFWHIYLKPKKECAANGYCATPKSDYVIKTILWVSTVLVLLALTVDYWAPILGNYI